MEGHEKRGLHGETAQFTYLCTWDPAYQGSGRSLFTSPSRSRDQLKI